MPDKLGSIRIKIEAYAYNEYGRVLGHVSEEQGVQFETRDNVTDREAATIMRQLKKDVRVLHDNLEADVNHAYENVLNSTRETTGD